MASANKKEPDFSLRNVPVKMCEIDGKLWFDAIDVFRAMGLFIGDREPVTGKLFFGDDDTTRTFLQDKMADGLGDGGANDE